MSTRQLHVDCKPLPNAAVDSSVAVYCDSAAVATGNVQPTPCPDDVREMQHKYYWQQQQGTDSRPDEVDQLPVPEVVRRSGDYSSVTGTARPPPPPLKLMPYGLPVCGDSAVGKLLTNSAPNATADYYQTPTGGGYMTHTDYVAYGYGPPPPDMAAMMVSNSGYHHQASPGYQCQRMTSPASQFTDIKAGVLPHGNTAELYQWVREQQNFAAANAIGINTIHLLRYGHHCNVGIFQVILNFYLAYLYTNPPT